MGDHESERVHGICLSSVGLDFPFFQAQALARRQGIKFYLTAGKTRFFGKREGLISNKFSSKLDSHVMGIFSPSSLI